MKKRHNILIQWILSLFILTSCATDMPHTEHEGVSSVDTQSELQSAGITSSIDSAPR